VGDWAAGMSNSSPLSPIWNSAILLTFYGVVVWLLSSLRGLLSDLENRVKQRTQALVLEMAERERLEKEIIEVSEREQRRIGRDIHDNLCQHLTGTALAGQVLRERLETKSPGEAADVHKLGDVVEEGIQMARALSRGIYPVDMEAEGLMTAFQEFAGNFSKWSKIECVFQHDSPVLIEDSATANQLYRIAREAVNNALRHGQAKHIVIALSEHDHRIILTIEDDGVGLPENWQKGLGTRIMAHRAAMIGGDFMIDLNPTGGTLVKCSLPISRARQHNEATKK
jgi:signal transduction histidine kinase